MKNFKLFLILAIVISTIFTITGFTGCTDNSDDKMEKAQEILTAEANAEVGMPAITNFREKKILKDIYELRDQEGLVTYTYIYSAYLGKFTYIGQSIGYGIPYATQFSNPEKYNTASTNLPQAEPNGLFSPASAEGTWVLLLDPVDKSVKPQYIEERVEVFSYKLPDSQVIQ